MNKPRWAGGKQVRDILSEMKTIVWDLVFYKLRVIFEILVSSKKEIIIW
jgi:hypothetical protein